MKNLMYKEFKLAVHPTCYIFLPLAAMLLIPNYPYYVAFFYQTLGIFFIFLNGNATSDIFFTTLLPIRKRDVVKARLGTVITFELLQIIVAIPFAFLRSAVIPTENLAGMEANAALFGLVFIMFGIFNLVFLSMFYRTAYNAGLPFLISCAAMGVFVVLAEVVIQPTPGLKETLDTMNPAYFPQQMAVLLVGMAIFVLLTAAAYFKSASMFEKLDL
jgi:hypothetical protein